MTAYGYALVSAHDQSLDSQTKALKAAGCEKIFRDKVSGARADRPQLCRLLAGIGPDDVVIVSRLDRLARSTRELLNVLDTLLTRGAAFRSLGEEWADTNTPQGRSMRTVLGGLAEFEGALIRARTGEGRARARARGQHMGRRPALTEQQRQEVAHALRAGLASQVDLARRFGVSQSTISRVADKFIQSLAIPSSANPELDARTERAVRAFMQRLEGRYSVGEAILFGSRARHTHNADSDADIAVVLKGHKGDRTAIALDMAGIAFDVLLESGILIEALPLWEHELHRPERFSNPALMRNIRREGIRL